MSQTPPAAEPLDLFLRDAPERISRLADHALEVKVPAEYRAAARSIARQAAGGWRVVINDDPGFSVQSAMREFRMTRSFGEQCRRVLLMVTSSRNPDLGGVVERLGMPAERDAAIMSCFFHYFAAHEFLHVEQGLGSDQYQDSDSYMPIVMEADHVADVAGLVVSATVAIPEAAYLPTRDRVLLLVAIHLASMHSFDPNDGSGLDSYAFSRLLVWYLHFARFTKAAACPDFTSPTFSRAWTVTLPRLLGRDDQRVTFESLKERSRAPYAARSDVVLGYQHEDGIYRIHRAALTDGNRVLRLAQAIVQGRFDDVRVECEELLVNNPAMVPQARRAPGLEWAAGVVLDELTKLSDPSGSDDALLRRRIGAVREAYDKLRPAARAAGRNGADLQALLDAGDAVLDDLEGGVDATGPALSRLRRRATSIVDQIALLGT